MAFAYVGNNSLAVTAAAEVDVQFPAGVAAGQIVISCFAFESVAAGSGPWIQPNLGQLSSNYIGPSQGWQQACFQAPQATGVGIEVWAAIYSAGSNQFAKFAANQNCTAVTVAYSGEYNPTGLIGGSPPRVATTAQVTGNAPPAPSVNANSGELIVACGGDLMTASLFGTPSGFTNRVDVQRSGAGTVEATIADRTATTAGATGLITFPNAASATTTKGATATLLIVPAPTTAGTGGVIDAGLPDDLDIGPGYQLRITALDPTTGNQVSGVNINQSVITAEQISGTPEELAQGQWFLVPGPNA